MRHSLPLAAALAALLPPAPAQAQEGQQPDQPVTFETLPNARSAARVEGSPVPIPGSIAEVRDPRGPVTAAELATGDFDVEGEPVHDNPFRYLIFFDRLEWRSGKDGNDAYLFEGFSFAGGDYNQIWLDYEGEGTFDGGLEAAELQLLYNRAITSYWNFQIGVRRDFEPEPQLTYGVIGFEGLNVYWSGVETNLYVSEDGDWSADLEVEIDEFLTQRLVLQPRFETAVQFQDVPELDLGSGITSYEAGLRLRYEFAREFAPYVGVSWTATVGETADLLPADVDAEEFSAVAGVRFWF